MNDNIISAFNSFIRSIDNEIGASIDSNDKNLTDRISKIQNNLFENYKYINGTSAGFHGITEYILFSAFRLYIESQNQPQKFEHEMSKQDTLRHFKLKQNNKFIWIHRSSSLRNLPSDANEQLFGHDPFRDDSSMDDLKLPAPDIAILKEDNGVYSLVAAIENKNFLDKGSIKSAVDMLSKIQRASISDHSKYAIFSVGGVSAGDETCRLLKDFINNKNNFLLINNKCMSEGRKGLFDVIDLSYFLDSIKADIKL